MGRYGFDGVVCTDWGLLSDTVLDGAVWPARAWGVEHLSKEERALKAIEAGIDQFGGEACPEIVVDLVRSGRVDGTRIDMSARRLLRDKFRLGLFDDPYVDPDAAAERVGNASLLERGLQAQTRSIVLLRNDRGLLPLGRSARVYVEALDPSELPEEASVVDRPEDADVAVVRLRTPYEPRDGNLVEALFHAGALEFGAEELARLIALMRRVPTVVGIYLDRPAVIPELAKAAAALLADFGVSDAALLGLVFGRTTPTGVLPFELPSSMDAVRRQLPDVPYDSEDPLFPFGHGLSY